MTRLAIFGTGGFAREVHQVVKDVNARSKSWDPVGFLDDNVARHGTEVHGLPVLGGTSWIHARPDVAVVVAIGNPATKRRVVRNLEAAGCRGFATLIHPLAWVGDNVSLGAGTVVCAGCLITTDLVIGSHVVLNLGCTVGHDTKVGDFVTAAPSVNISGSCFIGDGTDLGTGAKIIQGITIGSWSVVGAGAVVVRDLPPNVTAVGAPARPIRERAEGWHDH